MIASAIRNYLIGMGADELRGLLTPLRGELADGQLQVLAEVVVAELTDRAGERIAGEFGSEMAERVAEIMRSGATTWLQFAAEPTEYVRDLGGMLASLFGDAAGVPAEPVSMTTLSRDTDAR